LDIAANRVDVWVEEAAGTRWNCPECGKGAPLYDHAEERVWRHLNTCQCQTFVHARLPRTKCAEHGVRQVLAPWAGPGSQFTIACESWLIDTLQECDITGVSRLTGASWDESWGVMAKAVARGQARKTHRIPEYLSIDEKAFAKRHRYETLICDLKRGTVEHIVEDRQQESLERYYRQFTEEERASVKAVAMDMWDPYIAATRAYIPQAEEKIVFDHFHVTRQVTEALDKVRRQEHKALMVQGDEQLKRTRHLWLANRENVPEWRKEEFAVIRKANLKTGRAWSIKESLRKFWHYRYPKSALGYFRRWYYWATHSRLAPIVKAAKTLEKYLPNIMTYFKHRISNATAEGLNSKIQMVKEMACGFRNREHYRIAIYFHCGGLSLYP
jgi:transposase